MTFERRWRGCAIGSSVVPSAPETGISLVADAVRQLDEVLSLFAAILRVAEVESGETKRFFEPVDVTAMLGELAESYRSSVRG